MSCSPILRCVSFLALVAVAVTLSAGEAKPTPKPRTKPPLVDPMTLAVSATRVQAVDGGTVYLRHVGDVEGQQTVALWVPDGDGPLRGVLGSMHNPSGAWSQHNHAWARARRWAVFAFLTRWDTTAYEKLLPHQLGQLAVEARHPELVNVPWAMICGSRNVGASARLAALLPDRFICLLALYAPGVAINMGNPLFKAMPVIQINGSIDPFVAGMKWWTDHHPKVRAAGLPFTGVVDWDKGHGQVDGSPIFWPFLDAVIAERYPADADPTRGPVALKPWTGVGWLADPGAWDGATWGVPVPAGEYQGDPVKAVWLPDGATAATWRAFVSKDTTIRVTSTGGGGLALSGDTAQVRSVRWFDRDRLIGETAAAPWTIEDPTLATGLHVVHAVIAAAADGAATGAAAAAAAKPAWTQPLVVVDGASIAAKADADAVRAAEQPIFIADLSPADAATARALADREVAISAAAGSWKRVFSDDFSAGLGAPWIDYHQQPGVDWTSEGTRLEVVDGALQITTPKQGVALLRHEWPDDIHVTYRARALGPTPCDLSVVINGNPAPRRHKTDSVPFPWRQGLMFQFGAKLNAQSHWLVHEQPRAIAKTVFTPGQWHQVQVERRGRRLIAAVDGATVSEHTLSDGEAGNLPHHRMAFYTFAGTSQFDDLQVSTWAPDDPAAITPAQPDDAALDALANALHALTRNPFAGQRNAGEALMRQFATVLAPSFKRLATAGSITDEALLKQIQARKAATPPPAR